MPASKYTGVPYMECNGQNQYVLPEDLYEAMLERRIK